MEGKIRTFALWSTLCPIFVALADILGWYTHISILCRPFPASTAMAINTAVCFLLLGFGLLASILRELKLPRLLVAAFTIAVCVWTLAEYFVPGLFKIDELLVHDWQNGGWPGRMAPQAALGLILLSLALLRWHTKMGPAFATVAGIISTFTVLGYAFGVPLFYGVLKQIYPKLAVINFVAFNTSVCLISLSACMVACMPQSAIRARLLAQDVGGYIARRAFPALVIAPIVAACLTSEGAAVGVYPPHLVAPLATIFLCIAAVVGVTYLTNKLSKLDQSLVANERSRSDTAHSLAHDLKVQLLGGNRVIGLLLDGTAGELNETQLELLSRLQSTQQDMLCTVDDMVYEYRAEHGAEPFNPELVQVQDIVAACRTKFAEWVQADHVDLKFHTEERLKSLWCDKRSIQRLVGNLIHNALKNSEAGIRIDVSFAARADAVLITVADNGRGLSAEAMSKLFERFWKSEETKHQQYSNGLVLWICKQIAEAHGGSISCKSSPGAGSKFRVLLPNPRAIQSSAVTSPSKQRDIKTEIRANFSA